MENVEINKTKRDQETRMVAGQEYLTAAGAARYLRVSRVTVLNYVKQKRMGNLKFGGFVLFKQEDLDEFVNELSSIGVATRKNRRFSK